MTRTKLSEPMLWVLRNIRAGRDAAAHCVGRSQFGGHGRVVSALRKRGLIDIDDKLTEAGKQLMDRLETS